MKKKNCEMCGERINEYEVACEPCNEDLAAWDSGEKHLSDIHPDVKQYIKKHWKIREFAAQPKGNTNRRKIFSERCFTEFGMVVAKEYFYFEWGANTARERKQFNSELEVIEIK